MKRRVQLHDHADASLVAWASMSESQQKQKGGGGTGGLISGRGAANVLVRTTMGLAAVFFTTSVLMTRLNAENARAPTELERQLQQQSTDPFSIPASPAPGTGPP